MESVSHALRVAESVDGSCTFIAMTFEKCSCLLSRSTLSKPRPSHILRWKSPKLQNILKLEGLLFAGRFQVVEISFIFDTKYEGIFFANSFHGMGAITLSDYIVRLEGSNELHTV